MEQEIKDEVINTEDNSNNNGQPGQPGKQGTDGMAIASLILGIFSIVCCCLTYVSIVAAIVGLVLGILSRKKNPTNGLALAGIICSAVGLALSIIVLIIAIIAVVTGETAYNINTYSSFKDFQDFIDSVK